MIDVDRKYKVVTCVRCLGGGGGGGGRGGGYIVVTAFGGWGYNLLGEKFATIEGRLKRHMNRYH